jgi:hypothetical protein
MVIDPKPRIILPGENSRGFPIDWRITPSFAPNQVWFTDITYTRLSRGLIYLVAIDWFMSNGPVKSLNNRFKILKCSMYGRAGRDRLTHYFLLSA